ncbi:MAG: 50S ribosomal protein P1 [Caldivirga sp.]|jgi:large subunit ribosomal protein L12|uniref:50S ribosomal protein P1 n=1 Tax=Caldivirga sp. MU80 TaxID=1650354 RepID=UPI000747B603|nr:50S ribosomal protein P1 [Caldivirga sp. MU80]KUO85838.1 MAG: 50S ribosomal protein P1 [Caldivirga sp. MG_3]NAZ29192.1 50S ribosomal protein P1 [Caldivirga sp.]
MEYVYAALLLHYAKQPITEDNVTKVLQSVGIQVDEVKVKALVSAVKEVNIDEAIKSAVALPAAAPAAPQQAAPQAAEAKPAEAKAEEKKAEEKKEEETLESLASLFG